MSTCEIDVAVTATPVEVVVAATPVTVQVATTEVAVNVEPVDVSVTVEPTVVHVELTTGVPGIPGPPGPAGGQELFDSATPPLTPPDTYLRFERDVDGDVQAIYLGTVD